MNTRIEWKSKGLVLFFTCFLGLSAQAEMGFFPIHGAGTPAVVKNASASVTVVVSRQLTKDWDPTSDSLRALEGQWSQYKSLLSTKGTLKGENVFRFFQWNYCAKNGSAVCIGSDAIGAGTGFLFENPDRIATAYHVVADSIQIEYSQWRIMRQRNFVANYSSLERYYTDHSVFALMMPQTPKESLYSFDYITDHRAETFPKIEKVFLSETLNGNLFENSVLLSRSKFADYSNNNLRDVIYLKFQGLRDGLRPLKRAKIEPKVGDQIYLIGRPVATPNRRSDFNRPDSDGTRIVYTRGKVVPLKEKLDWLSGFSVTGNGFGVGDVFVTDADCEHGMSGGPALNEAGEVVGIITSIFPKIQLVNWLKQVDPEKLPYKGFSFSAEAENYCFIDRIPND